MTQANKPLDECIMIDFKHYKVLEYQLEAEREKSRKLMTALSGANTYLRDIMQLDRQNLNPMGDPVSIEEAYKFIKDVAANGYRDSGNTLDEIEET